MERRSFLHGTITLVLSQLLLSCTGKNQETLDVQLLKDSIPGQVVDEFHNRLRQKAQLKFTPVAQLQDLFEKLLSWQKPQPEEWWKEWLHGVQGIFKSEKLTPANLVTLGDYWIDTAIKQKLIQPLDLRQLKNWSSLPKRWQELVTRNDSGEVDAGGLVWAVPYRWGSTVIVYRRDKFKELGWTPREWSDLWRSELLGRISLLDQPREVIGLVLKKLGKSYNTQNLDSVPSLEVELQKLNQQVKFYSSNRYLEPLIIGDTWLAVGWSNDVLPVLGRYPELGAVIPESGTAMWADLWVSPAGINNKSLLYQWLDFCLTPSTAKEISLLTKSNSPIPTEIPTFDIPEPLRNLLLTKPEIVSKNEFLLPLPTAIATQYQSLYNKIKG